MDTNDKIVLRGVASDGTIVNLPASETFAECVAMSNRSLWVNKSLADYMSEQAEALSKDAETAETEAARRTLLETMHDASVTAAEMRARGAFLERRLDHSIKCLKRKGLFAEDLSSLDKICAEKNLVKARGLIQIVRCCMGEDMANVGSQSDLDETSWKVGIELAMAQQEPDRFDSDDMFGPVLEANFPYIVVNAMMAAYGAKLNLLMESDEYMDEIHSMIMDRYLKDPRIIGSVLDWAKKLLGQDEAKTEGRIRQLEQDLQAEARRSQSLEKQLRNAQKAALPNQAAEQKLKDRVADLKKELDGARAETERYKAALDRRDRLVSELSARVQGDGDLPPLPETDVVFMGGHINMVKKLKDAHPGWLFVDGTDRAFNPFAPPGLIFFWDKHMSHPAWQRAMRLLGPDTVRVYLKSTNMDLLELEMARGYAAARRPGED